MSFDQQVQAWQRIFAPAQMRNTLGPLKTLAGGGTSTPPDQPPQPTKGLNLTTTPPMNQTTPKETGFFWLTDGSAGGAPSIYYTLIGNPYATLFGSVPDDALFSKPSHPLFPLSGPVAAHLNNQDATAASPTEAQLYLGTSASSGETLAKTMPTDSKEIAALVGGSFYNRDTRAVIPTGIDEHVKLPDAVALLSPQRSHRLGQLPIPQNPVNAPTVADKLNYSDFYSGAQYFLDEIRAAKMQSPGLCSAQVALQDIYGGAGGGLSSVLQSTVQGLCKPVIAGASLNYIKGIPIIRPLGDEAQAEFFLNTDIDLQLQVAVSSKNVSAVDPSLSTDTLPAGVISFGCSLSTSGLFNIDITQDGMLNFALPANNMKVEAYGGGTCEDINFPAFLFGGPIADWIFLKGPKRLVSEYIYAVVIRGLINQILRSLLSFPIGRLSSDPQLDTFGCNPMTRTFRGVTPPPLAPPVSHNYDPDVIGDAYLSRDEAGAALNDICRLIRVGFSQTHSPNGPPLSLTHTGSLPISSFCKTLVDDASLLNQYDRSLDASVAPNTDEQIIHELFKAILATDANGNLRHWRCPTPCDPSENQNTSLDITYFKEFGDFQETLFLDSYPWFKKWSDGGCKSSLAPILSSLTSANPGYPVRIRDGNGSANVSPADPERSVITFYPPVRRVIMNPDSLQVVFIDDADDWKNASLAFLYALQGLAADPGAKDLGIDPQQAAKLSGLLCNYQRPLKDVFRRPFQLLSQPGGRTGCGVYQTFLDETSTSPVDEHGWPKQNFECRGIGEGCQHDTACCSTVCYPHNLGGKCICYDFAAPCDHDAQCCTGHCLSTTYTGLGGSTVSKQCGYPAAAYEPKGITIHGPLA